MNKLSCTTVSEELTMEREPIYELKEKRPYVWFIAPRILKPTGGLNNFFNLCKVFDEEFGIHARVISLGPINPFIHSSELVKYWQELKGKSSQNNEDNNDQSYYYPINYDYRNYNIPGFEEGDIVIQPELIHQKCFFSKPVRRIVYVQNWALTRPITWEKHFWIYNNSINLSYSITNIMRNQNCKIYVNPMENLNIQNTTEFIQNKKKVDWSLVTPYFDFSISEKALNNIYNKTKVLLFTRKSETYINDALRYIFGPYLLMVDDVSHDEVIRIMQNEAAVLVFPSPAEGMGFPAIEAMLTGVAIATWDCGAPEEFLIDDITAAVANFGDVPSLIAKVRYLMENPHVRQKYCTNALNLVKQLYTKEKTITELYLAYHRAKNFDVE